MSWSPVPLSLSRKNNRSHLRSNELDISLCSSASKGHQVCAIVAADVKAHSFADRCCAEAEYRVHAARVQWRLWKQDGCDAHLCERNSSLLKRLFRLSGNSPVLIHARQWGYTHTSKKCCFKIYLSCQGRGGENKSVCSPTLLQQPLKPCICLRAGVCLAEHICSQSCGTRCSKQGNGWRSPKCTLADFGTRGQLPLLSRKFGCGSLKWVSVFTLSPSLWD